MQRLCTPFDLATDDVEEQITLEKLGELKRIEGEVSDLHTVMKDTARLVQTQSEPLDDLESNISSASENIADGVQCLDQAGFYAKRARVRNAIVAGVTVLASLATVGAVYLVAVKRPQ